MITHGPVTAPSRTKARYANRRVAYYHCTRALKATTIPIIIQDHKTALQGQRQAISYAGATATDSRSRQQISIHDGAREQMCTCSQRFCGRKCVEFMVLCLAVLTIAVTAAPPVFADTVQDYLIQEVCDDGAGGHTSADPITCPSMARKLRIGEALPYHKWDGATPATARQIRDSFPIKDIYGRVRIVQNEYFDDQAFFVNPYFDASSAKTGISGYDLIVADGFYVSAAGTYDPGRGWQPFWSNSSCSRVDSWLYAPKALSLPFGQGSTTSTPQNAAPQCPTVTNFPTVDTVWNFYAGYNQYESGKVLDTIKSWHFGRVDVNGGSFEVFI